ncbi:MAG: sensor histidine kinase [Microbacterium sp.]
MSTRTDDTPRGEAARPRRRGALALWHARHPSGVWYAVTAAAAVALYAVAAPLEAAVYGAHVLVALFVPLLPCAALVVAVRFPAIAAFAFTAGELVLRAGPAPDGAPWPWSVTAMIGFVVLIVTSWARRGWRGGLVAYLVPGIAVSALGTLEFGARSLAGGIVALGAGAVAVALGALLHERTRIADELTHERALSHTEQERRLVAEERQRIARELHDVVAHGLSLIQVQATSARYRLPGIGEEAAAEFDDIAASARSSLGEMRTLLSALRGDEEGAQHAPQPTLADVPDLVAEARRAGARIALVSDPPPSTPVAVSIAAYRIVQEGISNAVRHAAGAPIDVAIGPVAEALVVEIGNGPSAEPARPQASRGPGHGLVGMRERATLLGGSLQAGRTASGGFRVVAELPLAPASGDQGEGSG